MTNLDRGPARCFLPSFGSFGKAISEQIFKYRPMRKQNCLCRPCLLTDRDINQQYLQRTFQGWFLPRFDSFGREVSEEKIFQRSTNQKHELPVAAMFVYGSQLDEQSLQSPSKDASYQISIHLAKGFQRRRFFRNQPIRSKNCLWWPCLFTDRNQMSNFYIGESEDIPRMLPTKF